MQPSTGLHEAAEVYSSDADFEGDHQQRSDNLHRLQHDGVDARPACSALRATAEYRAAWDIEVWKATQLGHFQTEFKDLKRKALEQWRQELKEKEMAATAALDRQQRDAALRERRIAEDEKTVERRKQKLAEAERELKALRQQMQEQQARAIADADANTRRVKDDMLHKVALLQQKLDSAEEATKRAEDRWQQSQLEYTKLFEEFSAFRTRQVSNPDAAVAMQLERVRSEHTAELMALQDRLDRRHQEHVMTLTHRNQTLEETTHRLSSQLAQKRTRLRQAEADAARLAAQLEHVQQELQRVAAERDTLHVKLQLAGTSKAALCTAAAPSSSATSNNTNTSYGTIPDIEKLRDAVNRCAQEDRHASVHATRRGHGKAPTVSSQPQIQSQRDTIQPSGFSDVQSDIVKEIARLERERKVLLEDTGGAYTKDDDVVQKITERISELQRRCVLPAR